MLVARPMETPNPFGGRLLAADEVRAPIERESRGDRVELLALYSERRFRDWVSSPNYVRIAANRKAGAHGSVLLVRESETAADPAGSHHTR